MGESCRNHTGDVQVLGQGLIEAIRDVSIQRYLRWKVQRYAHRMYVDCMENIVNQGWHVGWNCVLSNWVDGDATKGFY